ncbi:hypothetical protein HUJ04_001415 [Dendroctonus ponderosae]|nr:hypothetical protein HUJ04_001415 [Dendroctonus ponderosae]
MFNSPNISRQPADIMLVRDVFVVAEETGLEQEIQWTFSSNARYISTPNEACRLANDADLALCIDKWNLLIS